VGNNNMTPLDASKQFGLRATMDGRRVRRGEEETASR
jgi:hypothetical protein